MWEGGVRGWYQSMVSFSLSNIWSHKVVSKHRCHACMYHNRKYLLLTYENSNQVRDFHIPPDHRLGWTKFLFQPVIPMPYYKHECGISWNKSNKTKIGIPEAKPPQPSTNDSTSQSEIINHHQIVLYPSCPGIQRVCSNQSLGIVIQSTIAIGN